MTDGEGDDLLTMQENIAPMIAALTGMKRQFVDQGWSDRGAEEMVHTIFEDSLHRNRGKR